MGKRATVTEADLRRAIKAAKECGLTVRECIMSPAEVRLVFGGVDEESKKGEHPVPKEWPT